MSAELRIIFDSQNGYVVTLTGAAFDVDEAVKSASDDGVGQLVRLMVKKAAQEASLETY